MPRRSGRPAKGENTADVKKKIIDATIALIRTKGADAVTVRSVCREADVSIGTFYHYFRDKDDLMMFFLRETSFDGFPLETDLSRPGDRISELYMHLINRYMEVFIRRPTCLSLLIWERRKAVLLRTLSCLAITYIQSSHYR